MKIKHVLIGLGALAVVGFGAVSVIHPSSAVAVTAQTFNFPRTTIPAGATNLPPLSVPLGTTEVSVALTDFTNNPNAVTAVETDISLDGGVTWQFDASTTIVGSLTSVARPTGDLFTLRSTFLPIVTNVRAHLILSVPISLSGTITTR